MAENFDNAREETMSLFEEQTIDDAEVIEDASADDAAEEIEEDTPVEEVPPVSEESVNEGAEEMSTEQQTAAEAANTAQIAAETAAAKDAELQQALAAMKQMQEQNAQLQAQIAELSKVNEENLVEDAMTMPSLDVNGLAFADEATVKAAQEKYAHDMAEYIKKPLMKELEPFIAQAKEGQRIKDRDETIEALSTIPELAGIKEMVPQLDRMIANNKVLSSPDMPIEEAYIMAYTMAKGIDKMNTPVVEPKEPTTEELMELYDKYPEFQEMIERKRVEQLKGSQQVPPMSSSSGAMNAALNIKEKPKTLDEASELTRKMFI